MPPPPEKHMNYIQAYTRYNDIRSQIKIRVRAAARNRMDFEQRTGGTLTVPINLSPVRSRRRQRAPVPCMWTIYMYTSTTKRKTKYELFLYAPLIPKSLKTSLLSSKPLNEINWQNELHTFRLLARAAQPNRWTTPPVILYQLQWRLAPINRGFISIQYFQKPHW